MTKLITLLTKSKGLRCVLCASLFCWTAASCAVYASGSQERWTRAERSPFVSIVDETSKSVVSIQGEKQYENVQKSFGRDAQYDVFNGMGTGVIIDERGYILTNYHVVKGLLKLEVVTSDGERYRDVELLRNDVGTDLAILKIKPKKPLKKIRMGRADRVRLAEDVYAIGNPFGYSCSVSRGIVSSVSRPLEVNETLSYERVIQTDAAINPGNSGGPLINVDGEMIALNAAVREEAENIAFAIPVDVVSEVAERLLRQSVAKMTHHGLKFRVVDSDMPDYPSDGNGEDCLVVDEVDPHSPASDSGVKPGDVLLESNGYAVHNTLDFTCSLIGLGLSDVAELKFERDGSQLDATLAFSELSGRESTLVATDDSSNESNLYQTSSIAASFAEESVGREEKRSEKKQVRRASAAEQCVWDALGVEVESADAEEYRKRFPNLQAVAIGNFNFAPSGGVNVVKVDPNGLLASGDVRLQEGDFVFGFGVGDDSDGQLSVTSLENLYYIAKRLDEFAAVDSGRARVYLIRKGRPYFMDVDLAKVVE
ncbi:MAG: serine protease [Thermoguttaceae bacterium]|nr:serine protease [Thermoguttaceae bacterium]